MSWSNFNSHPRVGGDEKLPGVQKQLDISIRTPAWGVTFCDAVPVELIVFQFAPPRGG